MEETRVLHRKLMIRLEATTRKKQVKEAFESTYKPMFDDWKEYQKLFEELEGC